MIKICSRVERLAVLLSQNTSKWLMAFCCISMLIPVLGLPLTGVSVTNTAIYISAAWPMFVCIAGHSIIHRFLNQLVNTKGRVDEQKRQAEPAQLRLFFAPPKYYLVGGARCEFSST